MRKWLLNDAMRKYTRGYLARHPSVSVNIDDAFLNETRLVREECRRSEGGGGMCHLVSEHIQYRWGGERLSVSYLDDEGEVVCAGHVVNLLKDGSILDATSDQFGEGYDVRLIRTVDEDYGRYRPEFHEDFNPDTNPELPKIWCELWNGTIDYVAQDLNRARSGFGWWVDDPAALIAYVEAQRLHAANNTASWATMDEKRFSLWIEEIRKGHERAPSL